MKGRRTAIVVLSCLLVLVACTGEPELTASPAPTVTMLPAVTPEPPKEEGMEAVGWRQIVARDERVATSLRDVVATGPDTAWAVGYYADAEDEPAEGVLLRVDGGRWRVVENMSERFPAAIDTPLEGIDADGPNSVWAVGNARGDEDAPFALHWDGRVWRAFTPLGTPLGKATGYALSDVAVDGKRAVLIGSRSVLSGGDNYETPVLLSWDGTRFGKQELKQAGSFAAVDSGAGHTWIGGSRTRTGCAGSRPAIWHRESFRSSPVEMPLPELGTGAVRSIWQNSPSDVWAVGERGTQVLCRESGSGRLLVLHWDGTSWKQVELPDWQGALHSVTALGPDDVWVVGTNDVWEYGMPQASRIMLLHYDGRTWTRLYLNVGGPVSEDWNDYALARVPGTSTLLLAGSANCCDGQRAVIYRH
ncbi:hypothetical protein [Nonomuraea sp. NPDC049695]|uniref:hypothetical protein n=1 Tax=Nonomuraea sp. NPDC049695 TaxID=3154734 RepID=UPI003438B50D